ncbi:MAG: undecaprenyl-diphosphate phosphatase [Acetobacteraceae bacterium]|nr:undecaprenyl-diphosphate phosphatase [Acetobacteraceae bacterium]
MDALHAIFVAILQGATELFPVSSLGHAVVIPALLDWKLNQHADSFLPFLVLLHTGTAAALLAYFWRDWWRMARGVLGLAGAEAARRDRKLFMLIVIATIPAVMFGFVFNKFFRDLFATPIIAAAFLIVNGLVLLGAERLRNKQGARRLENLTVADAIIVGIWQCGALLPGISRSGATIVGGLLRGASHEAAAHFSFLIALPIIIGATVLEVPKLLHAHLEPGALSLAFVAAAVAGLVAFLSTWFLMRYFRDNDRWSLAPFGIYCLVFGAGAAIWLGLVG